MRVLHIKTFLTTHKEDDYKQCNYSFLSFVLGQHEEEDNDEQLLVIVFCSAMQIKNKLKKLTKGGRV
jgi:hypothetical protein